MTYKVTPTTEAEVENKCVPRVPRAMRAISSFEVVDRVWELFLIYIITYYIII